MLPAHKVRILVATQPVDFRKGHDGLAALVQSVLKEDPFTGTVFVFRAKRADRLKILFWDGTGLVMAYKRLEETTFTWPAIRDGVMTLNRAQFEALFAGLDWRRVKALEARRPAASPPGYEPCAPAASRARPERPDDLGDAPGGRVGVELDHHLAHAAAGLRASSAFTRRQSKPANKASNCARFSVITPSRMAGQVKVVSSSRL
ncbi:Mobile element protein [Salipiger mucosus DSM 16094]|uniref:Mobile element protein n=1 Tax=Salipiger mucosus DSM 16094 TaxID=1123237 RepID=S9RVU8_9RHOB|nr:IS66 family insertion sequence element accessory protein TnpB [Salipiger mucosus]EPX82115.1 Mobile element protein [Salipiger mucosus DSM 16094]